MRHRVIRKPEMNVVWLSWLLVVAASVVVFAMGAAQAKDGGFACTVVLDPQSATPLLREGVCDRRVSPASTFKVPLALMGFDAGVLRNRHTPAWEYQPEFDAPERDHKTVDPEIWQRDSVLWYSREITRRMGAAQFARYVSEFGYGNADVSGDPGKDNGPTHAWLSSSLRISADEQASFIQRLVQDGLPVSAEAQALTKAVLPKFPAAGGWVVHGKTGSIWMRHSNGKPDRTRPIGWFVGWAEQAKTGRKIIFAQLLVDDKKAEGAMGPIVRESFLKAFPRILARAGVE